jgi:ABC-type bacteriocin/lantibiotic exporter with double-glycine peptidase domain
MAAAYLKQPLLQADIAHWLDTQEVGTTAGNIQRLAKRGFDVAYTTGSLADLEAWLNQKTPPILFIRTGDLPYWPVDTPHAVVLGDLTVDKAYLFDPGIETAPAIVSTDELLLAWEPFDYAYAVITVSS